MKKFLVIASMVLCIVGLVPMGWAEDGLKKPVQIEQKSYMLDGKEYSKDQIIGDFLHVAFPDHMWYENNSPSLLTNSASPLDSAPIPQPWGGGFGYIREYSPWAYEYVARKQGRPKFDAINKWSGDITIGFGLPPGGVAGSGDPVDFREDGFLSKVKEHVINTGEELALYTGRNVEIIDREKESTERYARVRIVSYTSFQKKNRFKKEPSRAIASPIAGITSFENYLSDAVRFTPLARSQVEGYFIADANNNIDFSVCYIWPGFNKAILKSLVTECLVRAAGLPEMAVYNDRAVLGHWNEAYDTFSKRVALGDIPDISSLDVRKLMEEGRAGEIDDIIEGNNVQDLPEGLISYSIEHLSEYDRALLSILYCKKLQPGSNRNEVMSILYQSDECFQNIKQ